jgi:hypothetical protein
MFFLNFMKRKKGNFMSQKLKKPFPLYWSTSGKAASNYIEKEFLI